MKEVYLWVLAYWPILLSVFAVVLFLLIFKPTRKTLFLIVKSFFKQFLLAIKGASINYIDEESIDLIIDVWKKRRTASKGRLTEDMLIAKIQELETELEKKQKVLEDHSTREKKTTDEQKREIDAINKELQKYKDELNDLEIFRIQIDNLRGSTDYFRISKRHANASFIISVIACFVGLGLLTVAAVFAIQREDFRVAIVPAIGGAVANFIAATVFWVHNKSAQQLNRYYDSLHEIEVFLSSTKIIDKISTADNRDAAYQKVLDELFNIQKIKAAKPGKHDPKPNKEG